MDVLIGFEESQAVCMEFRKLGHNAFSCDLKPCTGGHPEYHLQMDIYEAINLKHWDFIGLHPTCTKMTLSGNRHYAPGKPRNNERVSAVEWTIELWKTVCKKTDEAYMENPMGAMNGDSRLTKPQIIQPYFFGDEAQKTTCLWLHNLPFLYHNADVNLFDSNVTHVGKGEMIEFMSKKGVKKSQPKWYADALCLKSEERSTVRSKTFIGIAKAMADQWGTINELNN